MFSKQSETTLVSLSHWFYIRGKKPLYFISGFIVLLLSFLMIKVFYDFNRTQDLLLKQTVEITKFALNQKNRVLIETTLDSTKWQLRSQSALLCLNNKAVVSTSIVKSDCQKNETSLFEKVFSTNIEGFTGYELKIWLPVIPPFESFMGWLLLVCLLIAGTFYTQKNVEKYFMKELFLPLSEGLRSNSRINIRELEALRLANLENLKTKESAAIAHAVIKQGQQIAHDIRSPLAALGMVSGALEDMPEELRSIIKNSISRIRDIANQLSTVPSKQISNISSCLLSELIESVVSEKRFEYRNKFNLQIDDSKVSLIYGVFVLVEAVEFKRVISNLINNAVEAMPNAGIVKIEMGFDKEGSVFVKIKDQGVGIDPDIQPRLFERGATFGKAGGSGLGLYYAKEKIEEWGGKLSLQSYVGKGTDIILTLKHSIPPPWFLDVLKVQSHTQIVILDDDQSVHQVWKSRFKNNKLLHFTSPLDFREWMSRDAHLNSIYFFDQELLGHPETGIELIEKFNLGDRSVLITSHYHEVFLQERAFKIGVKIVPKQCVSTVPINNEI